MNLLYEINAKNRAAESLETIEVVRESNDFFPCRLCSLNENKLAAF